MLGCVYMCALVVAPTLLFCGLHAAVHGSRAVLHHPGYLAIALFQAINLVVSVWEMMLHLGVRHCEAYYAAKAKDTPPGQLPAFRMFRDVSLREAVTVRYWLEAVWGDYSFLDASYIEPRSFGFWIDSGNGFSTVLPTLVFTLGLSVDLLSARHLGLVGILFFYQEFYGTAVYLWGVYYNRRLEARGYQGRTWAIVNAVVLGSNGVWFLGPALGMSLCYGLVMEGQPYLDALRRA